MEIEATSNHRVMANKSSHKQRATIALRRVSVSVKQFAGEAGVPLYYAKEFVEDFGFKTGERFMVRRPSMKYLSYAAKWLYRMRTNRTLMRWKYEQLMSAKRFRPTVKVKRCLVCGSATDRYKYCDLHAQSYRSFSDKSKAYYMTMLPEPGPRTCSLSEAMRISGRSSGMLHSMGRDGLLSIRESTKIANRNRQPVRLYDVGQMEVLRTIPRIRQPNYKPQSNGTH